MGKERRATQDILDSIVSELREESKSISDISNKTNINWRSVEKYLETLKNLNFVGEKQKGKKRIFFLKTQVLSRGSKSDTYFNLPSKKDDLLKFIYNKIKTIWKKETDSLPNKTQVYKVLFKVDRELKKQLKLPIGWYLYGPMCVKIFEPQNNYKYKKEPSNSKAIVKTIKKQVKKYNGKNTKNLRRQIYKEEKKDIYVKKEKLLDILEQGDLDSVKVNSILMQILSLADKRAAKDIADFSSIVLELIKKEKAKNMDIISTFNCLWKIIALYNFKKDMKEFYPDEILDIHFNPDFKYTRDDFLNKLSELAESLPPIEIKNKEIEKTRGMAKPKKNKKSRKQLFEESENEEKSDIFRKFRIT